MIQLIKKLWFKVFEKNKPTNKKEEEFKRKLEELKKRDPFIYKH
jgi:hypothetical protein